MDKKRLNEQKKVTIKMDNSCSFIQIHSKRVNFDHFGAPEYLICHSFDEIY